MSFQDDDQDSILKFVNPNTTMKEQRRFSYASMLSDPDPCYLPLSGSSSSEQDTPPPMMPYMDSLYVDIHQKSLLSGQQNLFMNLQRPIHYYDPQHKNFSQNENHLVYNNPMITPVSPPLTLKDDYSEERKSMPRSRGRRVSNIPGPGLRMFTCENEGCGKVFKRSEHLKRHIRSIHTLEKRRVYLINNNNF
ncbi:hypothetical protein G6F56_011771 [Rhizopus delemar]|nr:hypothetical protein G6F56_011771 [Rhizopus delemar]